MLAPSQVSAVQGLPSSGQPLPDALQVSAGQAAALPVQYSGRSQSPAAARHIVIAGAKPSAGQPLLVASQLSATSQGHAAELQTVPAGRYAAFGDVDLVTELYAYGSVTPTALRNCR